MDGVLLGFIDMSRVSDVALETIFTQVQPGWAFDLRPAPYFDIGHLNRKRMFELFRTSGTSYRDVTGSLRITERNDASLNSGAIAGFLNETLSARPYRAPIVVLVDDEETLEHAMRVLPHSLCAEGAGWCPVALGVDVRAGASGLVLRTPGGELHSFPRKWLPRS
jgi:hypothetical protein